MRRRPLFLFCTRYSKTNMNGSDCRMSMGMNVTVLYPRHIQFIKSGLNSEPAKPQMWSNHLTKVLSYHLLKYEYIFVNKMIHN